MPIREIYNKYRSSIRYILLLLGLSFVAYLGLQHQQELNTIAQETNIKLFVLSLAIGLLGNLVQSYYFTSLLKKYGIQISFKLSTKVFMAGQIAKYIPGKIWSIVYQDSHIKSKQGATAIILTNLDMMAGLLLMTSLIAVYLALTFVSFGLTSIAFLIGLLGFVWIYQTNFIQVITKKIKVLKSSNNIERTKPTAFSGIFIYLLFVATYIASNFLMLEAVFDFTHQQTFTYIALLSSAWIIGVLAFIFPAGMGIREVAFISISSLMLSDYSTAILTSIVVVTRFWQIIQELTGFLVSLFIKTDG